MKFHPKNGCLTTRLMEKEEITSSGIEMVRIHKGAEVLFGIVVETEPGSDYKVDMVVVFRPMLGTPVGWLDSEFFMIHENQILAIVEIEEGDNIKGEKWEKENPETKIIAPTSKIVS